MGSSKDRAYIVLLALELALAVLVPELLLLRLAGVGAIISESLVHVEEFFAMTAPLSLDPLTVLPIRAFVEFGDRRINVTRAKTATRVECSTS